MESSIAQEVQEAGQQIGADTENLSEALNKALNKFLGWPFQAGPRFGVDAKGQKTDDFGSTVYTVSGAQTEEEQLQIGADNLACVVDVAENLDLEQFRAAYERVACAKRLKKTVPSNVPSVPHTTVTLGVIFSRDTTESMETLAEDLDRLNKQHPSHEWVDMVIVLTKGTINYAVQFPGEGIAGDFFLPAENKASDRFPPAFYVVILIRPLGSFTFNKMVAFIIGHLAIFSPGAKLENFTHFLEGIPNQAMTLTGYHFNLSGQLVPVPRDLYNDRYLPPRPFLIEDQQGNLLSTLQFIPWQDGGVVLHTGKLPLEGLLVFLGKDVVKRGAIIKRDKIQISHVLPITQQDFMLMMNRIKRQSNMVVKLDETKIVAQRLADEGTRSPFVARLHLGLLRLRDGIFSDRDSRQAFDVPYHSIIENLMTTRSTSATILDLLNGHFKDLSEGKVGELQGNTIRIKKTIDNNLRKEVDSFLNSSVRTIKHGMQELINVLGDDISFLFKKQATFEKKLQEMEQTDPLLAEYLGETRKWSEPLIFSRNAIEHKGWVFPRMKYKEVAGTIYAEEPEISDQKVSDFVKFMMDRICCFVEEVTAHCLQAQMPEGISITEIPLDERDPAIVERFQLTVTPGGKPIWHLSYHESEFDKT